MAGESSGAIHAESNHHTSFLVLHVHAFHLDVVARGEQPFVTEQVVAVTKYHRRRHDVTYLQKNSVNTIAWDLYLQCSALKLTFLKKFQHVFLKLEKHSGVVLSCVRFSNVGARDVVAFRQIWNTGGLKNCE